VALVSSLDTFSTQYVTNRGLCTSIQIRDIDNIGQVMPDIDMHGYSLKLESPREGEVITSFPYKGKIQTYKGAENVRHFLHFFADVGGQIGISKMSFFGEDHSFDGELTNGAFIDGTTKWYVCAEYDREGYTFMVNTWGRRVHYRPNGQSTSTSTPADSLFRATDTLH